MTKTFKAFAGKNWVTLTSGDAFREANKAGKPIRVEFPNGSYRVIKNVENLPEGQAFAFTKAAEDRETAKQKKEFAAACALVVEEPVVETTEVLATNWA